MSVTLTYTPLSDKSFKIFGDFSVHNPSLKKIGAVWNPRSKPPSWYISKQQEDALKSYIASLHEKENSPRDHEKEKNEEREKDMDEESDGSDETRSEDESIDSSSDESGDATEDLSDAPSEKESEDLSDVPSIEKLAELPKKSKATIISERSSRMPSRQGSSGESDDSQEDHTVADPCQRMRNQAKTKFEREYVKSEDEEPSDDSKELVEMYRKLFDRYSIFGNESADEK